MTKVFTTACPTCYCNLRFKIVAYKHRKCLLSREWIFGDEQAALKVVYKISENPYLGRVNSDIVIAVREKFE